MKNKNCVQCGETEEVIRRDELDCGIMSHTEEGSEMTEVWKRHRFKPYTKKELELFKAEAEERYANI